MTTPTLGARAESADEKEQARLRYAMLSVYYRSLGSQLESQGAPVMAVPSEVRPLPLDEALARIKDAKNDDLLWEAYWRIVRAVPVEGWKTRRIERRYPPAFIDALRGHEVDVRRLDELRQHARANAHLLTAALAAGAEGDWYNATLLADMLEERSVGVDQTALTETTRTALGGVSARELVHWLANPPEPTDDGKDVLELRAAQLGKLPAEVGLSLNDFVCGFLDTIAFARFKEECGLPDAGVLTSSCVVRQDTNTLTTTATVTTLVDNDFDRLACVVDPLGWPECSDVIVDTQYLREPFDLTTKRERRDIGHGFRSDELRYLYERVHVAWGDDDLQTGEFQNVLAIGPFKVDPATRTITMYYRLCWAIDSRILWDERAGGILIDEGYILVRPVGAHSLRMTARKVIKFSDRTPYANPGGGLDFGQLLNYLAPASVTWWLETELCNSRCMRYGQLGQRRARAIAKGAA